MKLSIALTSLAFVFPLFAEPLDVSNDLREQASAGVGYLHAKSLIATLVSQGYELDDFSADALAEGFRQALGEKDSDVQVEDFNVAMNLMRAKLQERELALSRRNLKASEEWLAENEKESGVTTTDSGLQYEIIKAGEGATFSEIEAAEESDTRRFLIRYVGSTHEGTPFETSPQNQFVSVRENLLPGLQEALELMPEGSHWKLYLSPSLAYGSKRLPGKLPPGSVVVMDVFLADITP